MATDLTSSMERALGEVDVTCERVSTEDCPAAIADAVEEPAVGVSLDEFGVSLSETPVTVDPTPSELEAARTGVTGASLGVAEYGSLVLPQTDDGSELVSLFVDRHVAVLRERDVVPDMETAFDRLDGDIPDDVGSAILATGPSATADMGALVKGAHGPQTVHAVIVDGE